MEKYLILLGVFGCFSCLGYSAALLLFVSQYSTYEERAIKTLGKQLSQVHFLIDPIKLYNISILCAVSFFLLGFGLAAGDVATGLLLGIAFAIFGLLTPKIILTYMHQKRIRKLWEQLPDGLDLISSSLRAGLTLHQAIARNADKVPPVLSEELMIVMHECRLGNSLNDAMKHWAARVGLMDVWLVSIASDLGLSRGGNLADTYGSLSKLIRERQMFERELQTMTTEGRMQALVMVIIPFVILMAMTFVQQDVMLPFLAATIGKILVGVMVVMQVCAYIWIRKLVEIE